VVGARIGEVHVVEPHRAARRCDRARAGAIGDDGIGVEHLPHAAGCGLGLLGHGEDPAELLDRPDEDQHVGDERDEVADAHPAVRDRDRAPEQHRRDGEVRDEHEDPDEPRVHVDAFELRLAQLAALHVVAFEHLLAPPERLHDADALRVLLDRGGEVARLILDAPDDLVVVAFEAPAEHEHRDRGRHREQREGRVEMQQQSEDREHFDRDDQQEDRTERGEATDQRDIGVGARQQLARLPAIVEADFEPLQVLVEVVAQLRFDRGRHRDEVQAAAVREREVEQRKPDHDQEERHESGPVPGLDRPVDRGRDDERDREL
jgi:hypothetical protein